MDDLLRALPFDFDDLPAATQAYVAWRAAPTGEGYAVLQVWVYAYVDRYLRTKLLRESRATDLDLDTLSERVFDQIMRYLDRVREPGRFVHWVSRVCANAFRRWLRRRDAHDPLPDDDTFADPDALLDEDEAPDPSLVALAVARAIAALPDFLRPIAHRRFVEQQAYERIAADLGLGIPTVRSYVNKARERLRADPMLRRLFDGDT